MGDVRLLIAALEGLRHPNAVFFMAKRRRGCVSSLPRRRAERPPDSRRDGGATGSRAAALHEHLSAHELFTALVL